MNTENMRDIKEEIRKSMLETKELIGKAARSDVAHPSATYHSFFRLIDEFLEKVDKTILMNLLEPGWSYEYEITYEGISLLLSHRNDSGETDQRFLLFTVPAQFLTVEEYAAKYKVGAVTVRQWIRRGKIRTAKKFGQEWRISELADPPRRGYTDGWYYWENPLSYLPEEFSYLKGYCEIYISQCEDKQRFRISLKKDHHDADFSEEMEMSGAERERLELYLVGNPEIKLCQIPSEIWGHDVDGEEVDDG